MNAAALLTARQSAVLDYIRFRVDHAGAPPTYREIGTKFGITSPNGVKCHLTALEKKGCIEIDHATSRGIRLTDGGSLRKAVGELLATNAGTKQRLAAIENLRKVYEATK